MVVDLDYLPKIRRDHSGEIVALRAGCFDLIHEGHLRALSFASMHSQVLVVGVWSDRRVAERKGHQRPIRPQASRATMIDALKLVDYTIVMPHESEVEEPPMIHVVDLLEPDVLVVSEAQSHHPNDPLIEQMGVRIIRDPESTPFSSTAIIETIIGRHNVPATT